MSLKILILYSLEHCPSARWSSWLNSCFFVCLLSFPQGGLFPGVFEIFDWDYTLERLLLLCEFPMSWFQIVSLRRSLCLHRPGNCIPRIRPAFMLNLTWAMLSLQIHTQTHGRPRPGILSYQDDLKKNIALNPGQVRYLSLFLSYADWRIFFPSLPFH